MSEDMFHMEVAVPPANQRWRSRNFWGGAEVWQWAGTAPEFWVTPANKRLAQAIKREAWQSCERFVTMFHEFGLPESFATGF